MMVRAQFGAVILFSSIMMVVGCSTRETSEDVSVDESDTGQVFPVLRGDYLGQDPPGLSPELFASGIVSTNENDLNAVFSPDGREFYFSVRKTTGQYEMKVMRQENGQWTSPEVTSFSKTHSAVDPTITRDGNQLFFISNRPLGGSEPWDIWTTVRMETGQWGEPENLGPPINTDVNEIYPSVSADGSLYFSSDREGGKGKGDIYVSRLDNGHYTEPENVGGGVNTEFNEVDVLIAPDESYMVFISFERPDGYGGGDLYISFREDDSTWTEARNLGEAINSEGLDYCPSISPDGTIFFFTTIEMEKGDVFWVDSRIFDQFRE